MMTVETPLMNCHAQPHHPARPVSLMSLDAPQVTVVSPKASAVHFMKEKPKKNCRLPQLLCSVMQKYVIK